MKYYPTEIRKITRDALRENREILQGDKARQRIDN